MGGGGDKGSATESVTPACNPPNPAEQPAPTRHPPSTPRAEASPGARVPLLRAHPLFWWQQSSAVGTAARGRGGPGAGLRVPPGVAGPKSGEEESRPAASGDKREDSPLRTMRRAPSRARTLAERQLRKSLVAAVRAASMAARPTTRGG